MSDDEVAEDAVKTLRHTFEGSTRVRSARYHLDTQEVVVTFARDGVRWRFSNVDRATWDDFTNAGSAGKFLHRVLERHPNAAV